MEAIIKKFIPNSDNYNDKKVRNSYGKFSSIVGIIVNVFLFLIKLLAGVLSHSVAIIADSMNNLSDASSSIISLLGFRLAEKPADDDHPYGHGRYEYISALTIAVFILTIGIELLKSSFDKVINPTDTLITWLSIVILVISIFAKLFLYSFNNKLGKKIKSNTLVAAAIDSRNDSISTTAILISSLIMMFTSVNIDGYVGIIVAILILVSGVKMVKETLDPLLGTKPDKELVESIYSKIISYDNILGAHDIILHDYGPGNVFASAHVEMDKDYDVLLAHDLVDNIEKEILRDMGIAIVLHYDPVTTNDEATEKAKSIVMSTIGKIDSSLTIHDFRIVPGVTHTNVLFDLVVPHEYNEDEKSISQKVSNEVAKIDPHYILVIHVDRPFV